MKISLDERFRRACLAAGAADQASVFQVLLAVGRVLQHPHQHQGLGLRKIHPKGVWEVRVGLSLRALFVLQHDEATFVFLGTHDEVRRFLRSL